MTAKATQITVRVCSRKCVEALTKTSRGVGLIGVGLIGVGLIGVGAIGVNRLVVVDYGLLVTSAAAMEDISFKSQTIVLISSGECTYLMSHVLKLCAFCYHFDFIMW